MIKRLFPRLLLLATFVMSFATANAQTVNIYAEADPADGGVVTGGGDYTVGSTVTLTATPTGSYSFLFWEDAYYGDLYYTPTISITASEDSYYIAHFEVRYNINVTMLPVGVDTICYVNGGGNVNAGSVLQLDAVVPTGAPYSFNHWERDGVSVGVNQHYAGGMVNSDVDIIAVFDYIPQDRTISVASNDLSRGTVEIKDKHNTTSTSSLTITERDQLTLTATPTSSEYRFAGWFLGDELVSADAVYTFTLPDGAGNRTYTANFVNASDSYTMTAVYEPSEAASTKVPNTTTSIQVGNAFTYNTAAATNWVFDGWYDESENQQG